MSSFESICKKMASLDQSSGGTPAPAADKFDTTRHMPSAVAHELNNVLTIIQGYSERLLIKHKDNPSLQPQLQLISDSARRASALVRDAMPPRPKPVPVVQAFPQVDSKPNL
jgi:signal transduction histidine kinase